MKVTIPERGSSSIVRVYRENSGKVYKESTFWYYLKRALRAQGYDLIVANPGNDGHLTDAPYYLRAPKRKTPHKRQPGFVLWFESYQLRAPHEGYNREGEVDLDIVWESQT